MNLFKLILAMQGYPLKHAMQWLSAQSCLSSAEREKWILQQRGEILKYHFSNNEVYRKKLRGLMPGRWDDLPIIKKSDLQGELETLITKPYTKRNVYISNTSGSSGHPFFFAKDKYAHALTWAYILQSYHKLGIKDKDTQARFYGIPLEAWSNRKEGIKDFLMKRIRFPVFDLSDTALERFTSVFGKKQIHYIYGYTNSILLFAKFLLKKGLVLRSICPSLHLCIVTSEVCTEEDKNLMKSAFGVPVIREYGASELDVMAIEDKTGHWAINQSNLYIEVLADDDTILPYGNEGRIVVTSLHNKAMPFIRYDVGDIGIIEKDDQGLYLKHLSGRVNDTIVLASGKKSPGLTFYYISRSILESSGVLREFIIRQVALDTFEFDVVSDAVLEDKHIKEIQRKMDQYLEPGLRLKVNQVDRIVRPPTGKIKHFYSQLT